MDAWSGFLRERTPSKYLVTFFRVKKNIDLRKLGAQKLVRICRALTVGRLSCEYDRLNG